MAAATAVARAADLDVLVLCGGLGERLRPAVPDRPKALASVAGRAFLDILIESVARQGFRRFLLCTGHRGGLIRAHFEGRPPAGGIEIVFSDEASPLGSGGALRNALPLVRSDPCVVLNGDSLCEANLAGVARLHAKWGARAVVVVARVADAGRYGTVEWDAGHRVTAFREKDGAAKEGWVSAGATLLAREVIAAIPAGETVSLERAVYPSLVGRGLFAAVAAGSFIDIGTPADYARAQEAIPRMLADAPARRGGERPAG